MSSTPVTLFYSALIRVENAPAVHEELTRRLGIPDTCFDEPAGKRGALWVLESPMPAKADINEHLAWAASAVEPQIDFLRELVASGVRITLHLACDTNIGYALLGFNTVLFRPFVETGIAIEFYTGHGSAEL